MSVKINKELIGQLMNLLSLAISVVALVITYSAYKRDLAKDAFNFVIEKRFSTEQKGNVQGSETFVVLPVNGAVKDISADVYSALSYVDKNDGKEKIIPIRYIKEIKKNSYKDESLIEFIGEDNNYYKMTALSNLRNLGDDFVKDARIVNFFEVSYVDSYGVNESQYFVDGKYQSIAQISKSHFDKFKTIYLQKSDHIVEMQDLTIKSLAP